MRKPKYKNCLLIHGGIKEFENISGFEEDCREALKSIIERAYAALSQSGARAAVLAATTGLEDCVLFNAGTGSRIQSDGEIRMSASLMDGVTARFSGVINIQYVKNPILVAERLARERFTVLADGPATRYARSKGFQSHYPYTEHRMREHHTGDVGLTGTVGAVAVDEHGAIFAATSTGGVGGETPGRVSDTATVAGNYASAAAAVSCTGSGEEIVNMSVASRVAIRRLDGLSLMEAVKGTIKEGRDQNCFFGLIAIDRLGKWTVDQTNGKTLYAAADENGISVFE